MDTDVNQKGTNALTQETGSKEETVITFETWEDTTAFCDTRTGWSPVYAPDGSYAINIKGTNAGTNSTEPNS